MKFEFRGLHIGLRALMAIGCCWLACVPARAQFYYTGRGSASLTWEQIKAPDYQLLYPREFRSTAMGVAAFMDTVAPYIGYNFPDPVHRVPIVLRTQNMHSNGYVTWAPKRGELVTAPPTSGFAVPWLKQLSVHEWRHVVQMSNMKHGLTKVATWVLGEAGISVGLLTVSSWLLEGDATLAETQFSEFGRGKQPSFSMEYRALAAKGQLHRMSLDKLICGSYRTMIPDIYKFGYQITTAGETYLSPTLWGDIIKYSGKWPIFIVPDYFYLKNHFNITLKQLTHRTFGELHQYWANSLIPNNYNLLTLPNKRYTNYMYPMADPTTQGRTVVALKSQFENPSKFIRFDPKSGTERRISYTGSMSSRPIISGNTMYWTEFKAHPIWEQSSFSQIKSMDLTTGRSRSERRWGRNFYVTPLGDDRGADLGDGQRRKLFVYSSLDDQSGNYLVVADSSFRELARYYFDEATEIQGLASSARGDEVFFLALDHSGVRIGGLKVQGPGAFSASPVSTAVSGSASSCENSPNETEPNSDEVSDNNQDNSTEKPQTPTKSISNKEEPNSLEFSDNQLDNSTKNKEKTLESGYSKTDNISPKVPDNELDNPIQKTTIKSVINSAADYTKNSAKKLAQEVQTISKNIFNKKDPDSSRSSKTSANKSTLKYLERTSHVSHTNHSTDIDVNDTTIYRLVEPRVLRKASVVSMANLSSSGDNLYFESIDSGKDEIHTLDTKTLIEKRITASTFGAFMPSLAPGDSTLYLSSYTSGGYMLSSAKATKTVEQITWNRLPKDILNPPRYKWKVPKIDTISITPNAPTSHKQKRYSKAGRWFNVHSWAPVAFDGDFIDLRTDLLISLGLTAFFQSTMGDMRGFFTYSPTNGGDWMKGRFIYTGLPVQFNILGEYGGGNQGVYGRRFEAGSNPEDPLERYMRIGVGVSMPLNLSGGVWYKTLNPSFQYTYTNDRLYHTDKEYKTGLHHYVASIYWSQNMAMAYQNLRPKFGYSVRGTVLSGFNKDFGLTSSLQASGYLPGVWRNHSLALQALFSYQTDERYKSSTKLITLKGVHNPYAAKGYIAATAQYALPLAYPDWGWDGKLYIKRIWMNLYGGYTRGEYFNSQGGYTTLRHNSLAIDATIDFNLFRAFDLSVSLTLAKPSNIKGVWFGAGFSFKI